MVNVQSKVMVENKLCLIALAQMICFAKFTTDKVHQDPGEIFISPAGAQHLTDTSKGSLGRKGTSDLDCSQEEEGQRQVR